MGLLPLHVHLKRWHSFCLVHKICVPVTVTPFAQAGITTTKCCGDPVVTPGREVCAGVKNGSCFLTITQDICVAVPVEFGAVATVGDSYINCNGASE